MPHHRSRLVPLCPCCSLPVLTAGALCLACESTPLRASLYRLHVAVISARVALAVREG